MAFSKTLVSDSVAARLIETQALYGKTNRSFDSLVRPGASSVDIPLLAIPTVKTNTGYALDGSDRVETKENTTNVNVALTTYSVPLADEILSQYESGGMLLDQYFQSAADVLTQYYDRLVMTEIISTTNKAAFAGASMAWADIVGIAKALDLAKCPRNNRILIVDANIADEWYAVDGVKAALQYSEQMFGSGVKRFLDFDVYITGNAPTHTNSVGHSKYCIMGAYGPGIASILNRKMDIKSAWDTTNLREAIDCVSHFGCKLLANGYAAVKYKP